MSNVSHEVLAVPDGCREKRESTSDKERELITSASFTTTARSALCVRNYRDEFRRRHSGPGHNIPIGATGDNTDNTVY